MEESLKKILANNDEKLKQLKNFIESKGLRNQFIKTKELIEKNNKSKN